MLWQRFCKRVHKLIRSINLLYHNAAILDCVPKVMPFYVNVFGAGPKLIRSIDEFKTACVVLEDHWLMHAHIDKRLRTNNGSCRYAKIKTGRKFHE
jgi:hypothetical protein